jgi:hypothetical protein
MPFSKLDRNRLVLGELAERKNKLDIERDHVPVSQVPGVILPSDQEIINMTSIRIKTAMLKKKSVILAFGAHTIKNGLGPVLISLIEKGWITHLATNGAGIIHDWEFAYLGKSSEDVRENTKEGKFGLWKETGFFINLALNIGASEGLGYGESIGKMISQEGLNIPELSQLHDSVVRNLEIDTELSAASADLAGIIKKFGIKPGFMKIPHPFKRYSVQARAFELEIPFTGHPMFGHDIIYCHPMNYGASVGRTALNDFLCFADSVSNLVHGVYISVGSAVMSPMVFEKSLSMARNLKIQNDEVLNDQLMVIVDLAKSDWNWKKDGEPPSDNPAYYLRYCKTFHRMGGEMHYLRMDNRDFLLALNKQLAEE